MIEDWQINDLLRAVKAKTSDGEEQLSIIARALVVACKSTKVPKTVALEEIGKLFDEPTYLVRLA